VLVVDGRVAGVWDPGPPITVRPFAPLPEDARRAVQERCPEPVRFAPGWVSRA